MSLAQRHSWPIVAVFALLWPCAATGQDLWEGVNELHQLKTGFVDTLRRFAESAAGSYGDEGVLLAGELDAAQRALEAWDRAIATYEDASRPARSSSDAHAALGSVYLDRSRTGEALAEFKAAARLDPRRIDVHILSAMAYELAGDARNASAERDKAAALTPHDMASLYLAAAARADEDSPAAIEAQRRVDAAHLSADPTMPLQFNRAGLLRQPAGAAPIFPPQRYVAGFRLIDKGRFADGLAALRQAIVSDPLVATAPTSPAATAGARLRRGQLQAALSELRAATASPADSEIARVRGIAYWADEQDANSLETLTSAIRINANDERARLALAEVLRSTGRSQDAEQLLKETIAMMSDSGQAHYRLAQLYQSQSLVAEAATEFERAGACDPLVGLDYLYDTLGRLYATQANFDRAAAAFRRRIGANPNNGDAHRKLGEIYSLQGRLDAALAEFDVAERLDSRSADAFAEAAQVYLRLDRFADAIGVSRQALALNAREQKARFTLGTALVRLGNTAEGQRELDTFQREVDETAAERRRMFEINTLERDAARAEDAGDHAQAAALLQRALATRDDAGLEVKLAAALVAAGQPADALRRLAKAAQSEDRAEIHQIAAQAYAALGDAGARAREETKFRQLVEQKKEERLKNQPLLR
jgi:tetratricopeptide (TPR) repeat protein